MPVSSDGNGSRPWHVGVLFSRTGCMAIIEETQYRGTVVAIDEINSRGGINGRPIEPVIFDPGSENANFREYAWRMMIEHDVNTIFGCYTSSSRKAILPIIERLNGLLWYPTVYEGFEYSPNVIYTGSAPNQNSLELCNHLVETGAKRFFFVGSDYVYPRESNRIMRELVSRYDGEVVGESYVSLRARRHDFVPVMAAIRRLRPDVIFSTVVGDATIWLYQAFADAGFDPEQMPIASLTTTESEIAAMGFDVGAGHLTSAPYFQCLAGEGNGVFVDRYKKRYGTDQPTNMCAEAAYFQVHLFAAALEQTNTTETDVLRNAVLGSSLDAPQGKVTIDAACSHANLWSRIGRANRLGQFDIIKESFGLVTADPYLIAHSRHGGAACAR
jgi:ABC-type branched-subunit amino acid transport system substrate-binding protein